MATITGKDVELLVISGLQVKKYCYHILSCDRSNWNSHTWLQEWKMIYGKVFGNF